MVVMIYEDWWVTGREWVTVFCESTANAHHRVYDTLYLFSWDKVKFNESSGRLALQPCHSNKTEAPRLQADLLRGPWTLGLFISEVIKGIFLRLTLWVLEWGWRLRFCDHYWWDRYQDLTFYTLLGPSRGAIRCFPQISCPPNRLTCLFYHRGGFFTPEMLARQYSRPSPLIWLGSRARFNHGDARLYIAQVPVIFISAKQWQRRGERRLLPAPRGVM